jgi:hypothetical protein
MKKSKLVFLSMVAASQLALADIFCPDYVTCAGNACTFDGGAPFVQSNNFNESWTNGRYNFYQANSMGASGSCTYHSAIDGSGKVDFVSTLELKADLKSSHSWLDWSGIDLCRVPSASSCPLMLEAKK